MTRSALALLLCLGWSNAAAQSLVERAREDQVVLVDSGDPAMNKAFARAQSSLDGFLQPAAAEVVQMGVQDGHGKSILAQHRRKIHDA